MGALQFFLFGLFFAWFTGTGKLKALFDALKNEPPQQSSASEPQRNAAGLIVNPSETGPMGNPANLVPGL